MTQRRAPGIEQVASSEALRVYLPKSKYYNSLASIFMPSPRLQIWAS